MAHEEENTQRPLNDARDRLRCEWVERFRILREEMIKDVDVLIDLQDLEFKEMQRAHINHVDHGDVQAVESVLENTGDIQMVESAVEDLGDNLVNIWHFNNDTKGWSYYDGQEGSDLTHLITGETYLIQVKSTVEVILNGRARTLACVNGKGWNQIVW